MTGEAKLSDLLDAGEATLANALVPDAKHDAKSLLMWLLSLSETDVLLYKNRAVSRQDADAYFKLILKRSSRYPLQYIQGYELFMGYPFKVGDGVFIPRPETEVLCQIALQILGDIESPVHVLDLCSGSGAIGISLKKNRPEIHVTLSDMSHTALDTARDNAQSLGVTVQLYQSDLFQSLPRTLYQLIVCNPPYVSNTDYLNLQEEVLYEPRIALDGGENGMAFYSIIVCEYEKFLSRPGTLLLELGYNQGKDLLSLFCDKHNHVSIHPDQYGRDRILRVDLF